MEKLLRSVRYLGPLRSKGERLYYWTGGEPESVGYSGENTISALLSAKGRQISAGRRLRKRPFQQLIAEKLKQLELIDAFEVRQISANRKEYEVKVKTPGSPSWVDLPDVGFGISQVLIDASRLILDEYHRKINPNNSPKAGSAFLKWLLQVQGNKKHVSTVKITSRDPERTLFEEFPPDKELEASFDPADRKFIAVANAHPEKPPVLESADTKWLGWEPRLNACGIRIEFLCRKKLEEIRQKKTKSS